MKGSKDKSARFFGTPLVLYLAQERMFLSRGRYHEKDDYQHHKKQNEHAKRIYFR